jgi:SET domain-containing protein
MGELRWAPVYYIEIYSSKFKHSGNPNLKVFTEFDYVFVRATRNIKAGEEITKPEVGINV